MEENKYIFQGIFYTFDNGHHELQIDHNFDAKSQVYSWTMTSNTNLLI